MLPGKIDQINPWRVYNQTMEIPGELENGWHRCRKKKC
jgi:hypothetical protein